MLTNLQFAMDRYLQSNPARGVKFPQKGLKEKPALIAGEAWQGCSSRSTNRIGRW